MEPTTPTTQEVVETTQVVTPEVPAEPKTEVETAADWRDAEIKKLRNEAANRRTAKNAAQTELDALKASQAEAVKQAERAKLEETERLKLEKADVEKAAQERQAVLEKQIADHRLELRNTRAELVAKGLNVIDPSDAIALIKWADVEEDLSNLKDVMSNLVRQKPYLLGVSQTSATNPQTRNDEFTPGARIPYSKMADPDFIMKYEKEIAAALLNKSFDYDR